MIAKSMTMEEAYKQATTNKLADTLFFSFFFLLLLFWVCLTIIILVQGKNRQIHMSSISCV